MAAHAHDEKLLIHFFQDSLVGIALSWYLSIPDFVRVKIYRFVFNFVDALITKINKFVFKLN